MMESRVTISIEFPEANQEKWQALIEGLSSNEHGAYLEEYAEAFGNDAEESIGAVLDVWEEERGEIDTSASEIYTGKGSISIGGFRSVAPSIKPMMDFLNICGATKVELKTAYGDDWAD
jgi:hypothetical protein